MCRHHLASERFSGVRQFLSDSINFAIFTICGVFAVGPISAADSEATEPVPQEVRSRRFVCRPAPERGTKGDWSRTLQI